VDEALAVWAPAGVVDHAAFAERVEPLTITRRTRDVLPRGRKIDAIHLILPSVARLLLWKLMPSLYVMAITGMRITLPRA